MIFFNEIGQFSAEVLSTFDIILLKLRNSNIFISGCLRIKFSMNHTQIQPIGDHPFLTSCNIISCFKMFNFENSVKASNYPFFLNIQKLHDITIKRLDMNLKQ